ncbi:hypothetical protein ACFQ1M_01785 [Sungkyunkwania multivorans]|uniref:Lipocalin-like domain-containing protein n=1 Tax=Sungkyunkwania multivorans TaxID=1173618 RepID=A0ABW3CUQ2_9FLAO
MKNIIPLFLVLIALLFSCKPGNEKTSVSEEDTNKTPSIEGVWEMKNQYFFEDGAVLDSLDYSQGYRQVKMYHQGKIMWSRKVPIDSVEWYGYGTYNITDSTLQETIEYGSASMLKIIDTMRVFNFELILDKDTFSQISLDENGERIFSENYVRIE